MELATLERMFAEKIIASTFCNISLSSCTESKWSLKKCWDQSNAAQNKDCQIKFTAICLHDLKNL